MREAYGIEQGKGKRLQARKMVRLPSMKKPERGR